MPSWVSTSLLAWEAHDNLGDFPVSNFIVSKLFPLCQRSLPAPTHMLLCTGSILSNGHVTKRYMKTPWIVFGSGWQYQKPHASKGTVFFALRGKTTEEVMRSICPEGFLSDYKLALCDPAILLPHLLPQQFMGVGGKACIHKWNDEVDEEDSFTTDTKGNLVNWLCRLWSYQKIETDSLHAAIIADAYGIPWKPMRWELKWQDHFERVGINSCPSDFILSDRGLLCQRTAELLAASEHLKNYMDAA